MLLLLLLLLSTSAATASQENSMCIWKAVATGQQYGNAMFINRPQSCRLVTCDLTRVVTRVAIVWLVTWLESLNQKTRDLTWTWGLVTCDLTWTWGSDLAVKSLIYYNIYLSFLFDFRACVSANNADLNRNETAIRVPDQFLSLLCSIPVLYIAI